MPEFTRVHHIGLTVSDLERSVAFYTEMLNCEFVMRQEKAGGYLAEIVGYPDAHVEMCHVRAPGGEIVLELFQYLSPDMKTIDLEPRLVGNPHICLVVDDIRPVHERLHAAGVHFLSEPIAIDTGVNAGGWGVYLTDPDGIIIELFEPSTVSA